MNRSIKWKLMLGIIMLGMMSPHLRAQLTNGSFENYCGTTVFTCPTFASGCVLNWERSHGTPQINTVSGAADGNNFAQMWSNLPTGSSAVGEGIFASYTFVAGKKYRICMWVRNDVNIGRLKVKASNNLTAGVIGPGCAAPIPAVSFESIYDHALIWSSGWTKIGFDYIPTNNYNQFWVYPLSNVQDQLVWLNVDDIQIKEICIPSIVFNMSLNTVSGIVSAGLYNKIEYIYAGSSAGGAPLSSTVISHPNAHVAFEAGTLVLLSPNFRATPNSGQLFHAYINPCEYEYCDIGNFIENTEGINDPDEPMDEGSGEGGAAPSQTQTLPGLYSKPYMYPNPTEGTFKVFTPFDVESSYSITTITGQVIQKGGIRNGGTLDISSEAKGVYFLYITEGLTQLTTVIRIVRN